MDAPTREELLDAVDFALRRLQKAEDVLRVDRSRSLHNVYSVMIARVEHENLLRELTEFDAARSIRSVYASDKRSARR